MAAEYARPRRENERPRVEPEILTKAALIADPRETFVFRIMGDAPCVSPSGYYAWRGRPESPRKAANRAVLDRDPADPCAAPLATPVAGRHPRRKVR